MSEELSEELVQRGVVVPAKAKMSVVAQIYHQIPGDDAYNAPLKFSRMLSTDEQCYVRTVKVGTSWQRLDRGWVGKCSLMVLDAGKSSCDVEVGYCWEPPPPEFPAACVVHGGQGSVTTPRDLDCVYLRAGTPTAVQLILIPE